MRHATLLLALVACNGGEDTDVEVVCDATVTTTWPGEAANPVATGASIRVGFDGTASEATVTVTGPDGAIAGATTIGDGEVTFVVDDAFPEDAEISWTATVCDGTAAGTFTTGSLKNGVDPAETTDKTYSVDLSGATWVSPEGGGDLIGGAFGGAFLIGVQSASETELDCIAASGEETSSGSWQQDPCYATIDFEPVDFTYNPYFALETPEMQFTVQGIEVTIHDVVIRGGLTADRMVDGRFEGEVDMRDYRATFGDDGCGALKTYAGIDCVECRTDGEVECLWLEAVDVEGDLVPSLKLVPNENPEECNTGK